MATFQTITTDKKQYLPLLLLADPCEAMIDRYLEAGDMHVLSIGDAPVCVAVVTPYSDTACELKNLATDPQFQKQGYATRLMETLFKFYAARFRDVCGNRRPRRGFLRPVRFHALAHRHRILYRQLPRTTL